MRSFACRVARGRREIADAQRVRWRVYGEEERLLAPAACPGGREVDARDDDPDTVHLVVHAGDEPVGTVRLLSPRQSANDNGRPALGLELESSFDLGASWPAEIVPGEVTRYCVLRAYRCTGVAGALYAALLTESRRRGITHFFAAANMETDHAEDAAVAYRLLRGRGLVDGRFFARPRPQPPVQPSGRRACYSDEQRWSAQRGQLGGLPIPRTLALFATRMGARFIGPPAYDRTFNVFALPLVAPVTPGD
jgi:putative hemolysin